MIKRLVDAFGGREGYAGMAAYHDGLLIFNDALDTDLADKSRRLFEESEATLKEVSMAMVIRGFTVAAFRAGSLLIVCRFEGRFTLPPLPAEEETEYALGQQAAHLLTMEEAKKEAELMLRRLMSSD